MKQKVKGYFPSPKSVSNFVIMVIDNKNRDMDYFLLLASADFFQF